MMQEDFEQVGEVTTGLVSTLASLLFSRTVARIIAIVFLIYAVLTLPIKCEKERKLLKELDQHSVTIQNLHANNKSLNTQLEIQQNINEEQKSTISGLRTSLHQKQNTIEELNQKVHMIENERIRLETRLQKATSSKGATIVIAYIDEGVWDRKLSTGDNLKFMMTDSSANAKIQRITDRGVILQMDASISLISAGIASPADGPSSYLLEKDVELIFISPGFDVVQKIPGEESRISFSCLNFDVTQQTAFVRYGREFVRER